MYITLYSSLPLQVIYHYKYRSEEEYYIKSCVRGDSLLKRGDMTKCGHRDKFGNFPSKEDLFLCCFFVYNDIPKLTLVASRKGDGTDYDDGAWKQLKKQVPKYAIFDRMTDVSLY